MKKNIDIIKFRVYICFEMIKMGGNWCGARPGAGRKKTGKKYVTISIAGYREDIAAIRKRAKKEGKTVSRYVIDTIKRSWEAESVN